MKRILTIQDISCVGKCSLTVALPVISAFGVETCVLPTAVLSTHTAFNNFTFRDLTGDINAITKHWQEQNITFDAIYTGYLGSFEQLKIVSDIFDKFRPKDGFIIVDPVMADNGALYSGFSQEFVFEMAKLCNKADIIVPNMTEACFMLNIPYVKSGYKEEDIKDILKKLTDGGAKTAILTGVSFDEARLGAYGYDSVNKKYFSYFSDYIPASFHGTGDIFASTITGALSVGKSLENALKIAVDFTVKSIEFTVSEKKHNWYGVNFENAFPYLIKEIEKQ